MILPLNINFDFFTLRLAATIEMTMSPITTPSEEQCQKTLGKIEQNNRLFYYFVHLFILEKSKIRYLWKKLNGCEKNEIYVSFAEQTVPWHRLRNSQQHLTVQQRRPWMRKLSVPCMDRTKNGSISMQKVLQTSREIICTHQVLGMKFARINLYILWIVFKTHSNLHNSKHICIWSF